MAHGKMSIVAPVATVVSACLPVGYSTLRQGAPGGLTLVGYAVAFVAVFLVSSTERIGVINWRSLRLPVLAGVIAGVMFILIGYTTERSTYTPLLIMRTTSFLGNLIIASRIGAPRIVPLAHLPAVLMTGMTSAAAMICFVLAAQVGRLDIASVLSALAPAVTVILAAVFLREHINRVQVIGIALATGTIALISV
jgi:drug/metabolite transporter (DMT)-like permease